MVWCGGSLAVDLEEAVCCAGLSSVYPGALVTTNGQVRLGTLLKSGPRSFSHPYPVPLSLPLTSCYGSTSQTKGKKTCISFFLKRSRACVQDTHLRLSIFQVCGLFTVQRQNVQKAFALPLLGLFIRQETFHSSEISFTYGLRIRPGSFPSPTPVILSLPLSLITRLLFTVFIE